MKAYQHVWVLVRLQFLEEAFVHLKVVHNSIIIPFPGLRIRLCDDLLGRSQHHQLLPRFQLEVADLAFVYCSIAGLSLESHELLPFWQDARDLCN